MEITLIKASGKCFSNSKTAKMKKQKFENIKEQMEYVLNFISEKASAKTTTDNPSHLKGAKFVFLKESGREFDRVEFSIPGTKEEINQLMNIVFN